MAKRQENAGDETPIEFPDEGVTTSARVSAVGPGLFRLESIPVFVEGAAYGDAIEAERRPDGSLRFKRVVQKSDWKCFSFGIPEALVEAPHLLATLDRVVQSGGHWERIAGGCLFIYLPPSVDWDPTPDIMVQSSQGAEVRRSGQVAADRETAVANVIEVAVNVPDSAPPPAVSRSTTGLIKRSCLAWLNNSGFTIGLLLAGCCFLSAFPVIMMCFRGNDDLIDEIVARKIAYCAWQGTSLADTNYSPNLLLAVLGCILPAALALVGSLRLSYPRWYIPAFVIAAWVAGTLLFAPQFLAHSHFQIPSTTYFTRNGGVSLLLSGFVVGTVLVGLKREANSRLRGAMLVGSCMWNVVGFHCLASFFYIFSFFVAVE